MVFLAAKTYARYWPHEPAGLAGEVAALVLALAAGWGLLRMRARASIAAGAAVFAYLALSTSDPRLSFQGPRLGGPAGYLHRAAGCEFAVRFPGRPGIGRTEARGPAGTTAISHRAELAVVGRASAYRAECLVFSARLDEAGRAALASWAAEHLGEWAAASGGAIEDMNITVDGERLDIRARHTGRDEANKPLPSAIAGRAMIGERSMMAVMVTRLGGGEPDAEFLASLGRPD
jgi:hypothetical protein